MQPPNTARLGRSVWDGVDRRKFESHVDAFSRTGFVPDSQVLLEEDWPKECNQDVLPFAIEKQLSDDFAFIAACEYGVGYVTVATVEPARSEPWCLTLRLAANEGICDRVKCAIDELFGILERCATKKLSREQCAEEVFDTVIKLNNNRILGRLASRLFQRPLYDRGPPRSPLTVRLKGYIASRSSTLRTSQTSADVGTLSAQINAFHASFLQLESSTVGEILSATKSLVKEAFLISEDGFSLCTRLEAMGFPASIIDTREIREVNKIANYWRICRSLAHLSRSYRLLFTRLRLETLEPYEPSSASSMKPKRFVHAEVQMIVFYETSSPPPWPRAIGASKEACFLCDSFVIAHGYFYLSKAHRQIFPQWAVPDRGDYSTSTLQRFRSALATVDQSVMEGLKNARRNRSFRPFPLQSSINLLKPMLPTPSMTTIRSSGSEIEHGVSSIGLPATSKPATPRPVTNLRNDNVLALDGVKPNEDSASPPSIDAPPLHLSASAAAGQTVADDVVTEAVEDLTTTTTTTTTTPTPSYAPIQGGPSTFPAITFTSAIHTTVDWLSLHIQLEAGAPPLGKGAPVATGPPWPSREQACV